MGLFSVIWQRIKVELVDWVQVWANLRWIEASWRRPAGTVSRWEQDSGKEHFHK